MQDSKIRDKVIKGTKNIEETKNIEGTKNIDTVEPREKNPNRNIVYRVGKCLVFWGILAVLIAGLSNVTKKVIEKDDQVVQNRNKSYAGILREPKDTIDIIVLGDSESYTTISPMELWSDYGVTSYICAQSGQRIQETYYLLKTALENQNPKLVLIETNVLFRSQRGVKGMEEAVLQAGSHYIPLFGLHDIWKPLLMGKKYDVQNYKGFTLRKQVQSYDGGDYMEKTSEKTEITDMVKDYMDKIIDLCKEHEIPLMLYSAPSPVNYNYKKHNTLQEYAGEHEIPYLDLNLKLKELDINWKTDSLDKGDHLNLSGANKVTKFMGENLTKHYKLESHKGKSAYAQWQKESENYNKEMTQILEFINSKYGNIKK